MDLLFRALIVATSAPLSLKSNTEHAAEHKRVACVLFLDLCLKRSLSGQEGEQRLWQQQECVLPSS